MGCFIGCFGSSKNTKCRKQRYKVIRRDQKPSIQNLVKADVSLENSIIERPSNPVSESREKTAVALSLKRRKKVTFDTNVTTYEHIQVYDSTESLLEKNEKSETFPSQSDTDSRYNSVGFSMPNYRYGNCLESDDEVEEFDHEDYDLDQDDDDDDDDLDDDDDDDLDDDDDDDGVLVPSMESRGEPSSLNTIGLNRNARDKNGYVLSVLNPVENLAQWKALKSKGRTRKPLNFDQQKENSSPDSIPPEPKNRNQNQETMVDASLSNWLISLEKNTRNNKRVACYNTQLETTTTSELNGKFLD